MSMSSEGAQDRSLCNAKILRLYNSFVIYFQITFKIDNFAY